MYMEKSFGRGLEEQEKFPNRIRYTGQQYDGLTGQYYLRARYYNPAYGRFMQEDVYQGDGLNLYAYCDSNLVVYYDPSGYNAAGCGNATTRDTDDQTINTRTEQTTQGNVEGGGATSKPNQVHHYATNKSTTYTQAFMDITDKYGLDLDGDWNKDLLPHQGRHLNAYHDFVLDEMRNIDNIANGNKDIFLDLYKSEIKSIIRDNPDMLLSETHSTKKVKPIKVSLKIWQNKQNNASGEESEKNREENMIICINYLTF